MSINIYLYSVADKADHNGRTSDRLENFYLMGITHTITPNVMLRGKVSWNDITTGELLRTDVINAKCLKNQKRIQLTLKARLLGTYKKLHFLED